MKLTKKQEKIITVVVIVLIAAWYIYEFATDGFSYVTSIGDRKRIIIKYKERFPRYEVSSHLVADGKIFLHYDSVNLVNVYSVDGEYNYSIFYGDWLDHGTSGIFYQEGKLIIYTRRNSVYVMDGTELVEYKEINSRSARQELDELIIQPYEQEFDGSNYVCTTGDVKRENPDGSYTTVIDVPELNNDLETVTMFLLIALPLYLKVKTGMNIPESKGTIRPRAQSRDKFDN